MTRTLKVRGRGEFILFRSEVCIRTCPAFQNRGAEREDWCYQNSEERKNVFYILRRGGGGAFEADGEEGKFLSGRIHPLIWSTWTREKVEKVKKAMEEMSSNGINSTMANVSDHGWVEKNILNFIKSFPLCKGHKCVKSKWTKKKNCVRFPLSMRTKDVIPSLSKCFGWLSGGKSGIFVTSRKTKGERGNTFKCIQFCEQLKSIENYYMMR